MPGVKVVVLLILRFDCGKFGPNTANPHRTPGKRCLLFRTIALEATIR